MWLPSALIERRGRETHGLRQIHELTLCGGAAEHQLTLISDVAEITHTYPTPPDEVRVCGKKKKIILQTTEKKQKNKNNNHAFANMLFKMEESTAQKQV